MYKIATLNKISPVGLKQLPGGYILVENASEADGILVRSQDMHEMELGDKLKAIARAGAGVNNIPLDKCAERGIVVFNTPGANANAVKELVLCGLLLAARNVPSALSWAAGLKEDVSKTVEKGKSQFAGSEILGKTLGVVGLGAIGRKVAASAKALGMEIVGYDPYYVSGGEGISVYSDLGEMLSLCDYVTLHLPANDSTKGMMNAELFDAMKDGTVLLNFSRDKLVNELDLAAAMESGKVAKYVTDFPNDNMVGRENVILLPHLGASTAESEDNCAVMAARELREYLENGNIRTSVNLPEMSMERSGVQRLCILHKNVPGMLANITSLLSKEGVNVENMTNKSKGDYAYTMVDLSTKVGEHVVEDVKHMPNVIRVRVLEW